MELQGFLQNFSHSLMIQNWRNRELDEVMPWIDVLMQQLQDIKSEILQLSEH